MEHLHQPRTDDELLFPPRTFGRYVRVTGDRRGRVGHGYCISSAEVYGCNLSDG